MENAPSDGAGNRVKHAIPAQNKFRWVTRRAEERGMRVNTSKTAMTCISDAMSYKAEAYIEDADGGQIRSGPTMKVLGFHFSDRPTMHAHVQALQKRFRRQYWTLYHLRKAGFTNDELAKVYRTVILPLADYCQVIYHSMITDKQDQAIERLQARALKCIYGPYPSYAEMRKMAGVTTLRQRRIEATDKFAYKCLTSSRFSEWFPAKPVSRGRKKELYLEEFARCNRLKNTPIFYMRRRLNGKPGRYYGERNRAYRDT